MGSKDKTAAVAYRYVESKQPVAADLDGTKQFIDDHIAMGHAVAWETPERAKELLKETAIKTSIESVVMRPHWPEGLEQGRFYQFNCDDDGRDGDAFFRVLVANDSDVHLCASKLIDPGFTDNVSGELKPPIYDSFPSVRCRTGIGGGRHIRTRQALLWLAMAIKLDNDELGISD